MNKIIDSIVTVSQNCKIKNEGLTYSSLLDIFQVIKTGDEGLKRKIGEIRKLKDHKEQNNLKLRILPVFIPTGSFTRIADDGITDFNGVVCLDIDNLNDYNAEYKRLKAIPQVLCIMKSPTNNMKVFVATDLQDPKNYSAGYLEVGNQLRLVGRIELKLDLICRNISHPCFFSYDPSIYINKNATPLHVDINNQGVANQGGIIKPINPVNPNQPQPVLLTDSTKIREAIIKEHTLFEKYYSFKEGNRNLSIYILASYLREEGVPETNTGDYLSLYYGSKDFSVGEIRKAVSSAYK